GVRWNVPEQLAGGGVDCVKLAITGSTAKHQSAAGRQHRAPVGTLGIVMRPDALAGVDIPCLDFTEVIRPWSRERLASPDADKRSTRCVLDLRSHIRSTDVVIRWNINHPCLRTECNRRPVLSAVSAGAELGALAGSRLVRRI